MNPKHPNMNERIFVNMYDSNLKKCLSSADELGEYLYSLYCDEIKSKKFSLKYGEWTHFSDIEIKFINNIIESMH